MLAWSDTLRELHNQYDRRCSRMGREPSSSLIFLSMQTLEEVRYIMFSHNQKIDCIILTLYYYHPIFVCL